MATCQVESVIHESLFLETDCLVTVAGKLSGRWCWASGEARRALGWQGGSGRCIVGGARTAALRGGSWGREAPWGGAGGREAERRERRR